MAAVVLVSIVVVVGQDLSVLNVKMKLKKDLQLKKTGDVREKNLFDFHKSNDLDSFHFYALAVILKTFRNVFSRQNTSTAQICHQL
jgi:hypothetical protein